MSEATLPAHLHLGFLTVFAEPTGYLGGYLVTNSWGRPLEFRLSTAVQPNKVQQILYGPHADRVPVCRPDRQDARREDRDPPST